MANVNYKTISKAGTTLNLVRCQQIWTIENFFYSDIKLCTKPNRITTHRSANFYNPTNPSLQFYMKLYPRGFNEAFKDYISVFVHWDVSKADSSIEILPIGYKFAIINDKGEHSNIKFRRSKFNRFNFKGYGCAGYLKRAELFKLSNHYLPNDCLTIYCEVTYVYNVNSTVQISHINANAIGIDQLEKEITKNHCQDMDKFWMSPIGQQTTDVVLQVGNREMHVHKLFLTHRSSIWAALFDTNIRESIENRLKLVDIEWDVLHELMRFIYTDKIPKLDHYAEELLVAANKYDIQYLKSICEGHLTKTLNPQNVDHLFQLADMHNAATLKQKAFEYDQNITGEKLKSHSAKDFLEVTNLMKDSMKRKSEMMAMPSSSQDIYVDQQASTSSGQ